MIALSQISMVFGTRVLFLDVNLNLNNGQKYALVGANGCGKSTFFKLITGEEEPTTGDIIIPKDASIGWLKQDQFRYENTLIRDIVMQGKEELWQAYIEKEALLADDAEWDDAKGYKFAELEETFNHFDGYNAPLKIETILTGLGIPQTYHDKPLSALSGGYKLRVLLAQVLFQEPSILILDEPTNHLDIESIKWLETFLKYQVSSLVVFISHDVEFINHLADTILDVDYCEIRSYTGNYQKFIDEKQLIEEQKLVEKKSAEEKVAHMQKFVDRFKATASKAAQARSRMKMIEKIEINDLVKSSRIAPTFKFALKRSSGKQVCIVENLAKSWKEKSLFSDLNLKINRHDKLAIIGANGRGKSTLIKLLLDQVEKDAGVITWGHETHISYFSQDHHDLLNVSQPMLQWLTDQSTHSEQQVRKQLGQMLFTKDDVEKDILSLSGGEAARLLIAKVILESPNVLILDEPTNHMDLETIESLANALAAYEGTLIFVSHNRYFIETIATRILFFPESGAIQDYHGTYEEFEREQA